MRLPIEQKLQAVLGIPYSAVIWKPIPHLEIDGEYELLSDLRVNVGYEFIRKLWLLGGVDDILNSDRRDYFIGLQLRFTDSDLKTILPFAGSAIPR